jgi:hypothetical protein
LVKILSPPAVVSNLLPSSHENTVLPLSNFAIDGPAIVPIAKRLRMKTAVVFIPIIEVGVLDFL